MNEKIGKWLLTGNICASSRALAAAALGAMPDEPPDYPHDSNDFGRCILLYRMAPETTEGLARLAAISNQWKRLSDHWNELIDLLGSDRSECTRLIDELVNPRGLRVYEFRRGADDRWDIFPWSDDGTRLTLRL